MTSWIMNAVGLLTITVGALMLFLHLHRAARRAETGATIESSSVSKERRLMKLTVGLLSAWFVIHYLALILP